MIETIKKEETRQIEVGDTVLCINNKPLDYPADNDLHDETVAPPLEEGKEYPVTEIYTCGCGKRHIGVGLPVNVSWVTCVDCGDKMPLVGKPTTHWCHPSRFTIVEPEKGTFRLGTVEEAQKDLAGPDGFVHFVD